MSKSFTPVNLFYLGSKAHQHCQLLHCQLAKYPPSFTPPKTIAKVYDPRSHEIELRVQGLGLMVQGLGSRIQGLGFRVEGLGCRVYVRSVPEGPEDEVRETECHQRRFRA